MRKLVGPGVPPKRHPRGPMRTHEEASGPPVPPERPLRDLMGWLVDLHWHPRSTQEDPEGC